MLPAPEACEDYVTAVALRPTVYRVDSTRTIFYYRKAYSNSSLHPIRPAISCRRLERSTSYMLLYEVAIFAQNIFLEISSVLNNARCNVKKLQEGVSNISSTSDFDALVKTFSSADASIKEGIAEKVCDPFVNRL